MALKDLSKVGKYGFEGFLGFVFAFPGPFQELTGGF